MSKYIVSANYRNRKSDYCWLVRKADQPMEEATACSSIRVIGAQFVPSSAAEEGFGCKTVALCDDVCIIGAIEGENTHGIPTNKEPSEHRKVFFESIIRLGYDHKEYPIGFDGYSICRMIPIERAASMCLNSDRTMFGTNPS